MPHEERSRDAGAMRLDDLVQGVWEESSRLETVLVVHGYPSLREALARTLDHYGYRAVEASTREQALRVVRHERIDLVLLDIELGDDDGPALAAELNGRIETRHIPVIGLSSDQLAREAVRLYGLNEVLVMPAEQKELLAVLDRSLDSARREERRGLRLEPADEQCRLTLEDRLRSEHLTLFFRFPARTHVEMRAGNEPLIHDLSARLTALGIQPEIRMESGHLVLQYDLTIADALYLATEQELEPLVLALCEAFPELAKHPDSVRRRLETLRAEFRRLQRLAS